MGAEVDIGCILVAQSCLLCSKQVDYRFHRGLKSVFQVVAYQLNVVFLSDVVEYLPGVLVAQLGQFKATRRHYKLANLLDRHLQLAYLRKRLQDLPKTTKDSVDQSCLRSGLVDLKGKDPGVAPDCSEV
jgi:hypothetical protein